jgi:hypothetical protein
MLIPFTSKAAADFFMLQTHATPLFELMDKPLTTQGVIAANETAACLSKLQAGLANTSAVNPAAADNNSDHAHDAAEPSIGLKQRAWPLLDMLERASKKQVDVFWGVNT